MDFANQAHTKGISKFASLMGYYATLFTLQVLVWEMPYLFTITQPETYDLWDFENIPFYISSTIFVWFLLFVLWYFLYPQFLIIQLVKNHKRKLLENIQLRIRKIYTSEDAINNGRASIVGQYLTLYKEIDSLKGALPLQNIIGFSASFIASFAMSLASNNPDLLN